jgi:UDP-glucose 4-epimerase
MPKNILLIGAGGFIGRNIVASLSADGHKLYLLTRDKDSFYSKFDQPSVHLVIGRLTDLEILKRSIVKFKIDTVIHLAATLIPSSGINDFNREYTDVVLPTFYLLHFLSTSRVSFVYFSSGGTVYEDSREPVKEDYTLNPRTFYGYSKLLIENQIRFFNKSKNLQYIILRPSNAYGKYQRSDKIQGFIAVALNRIQNERPIKIYGDGSIIRDYINVSDIAYALSTIIKHDIRNQVINLGSGVGTTLMEILNLLEMCTKKKSILDFAEKRDVDALNIVLNIEKLTNLLKFTPQKVHDGIVDYVNSQIKP